MTAGLHIRDLAVRRGGRSLFSDVNLSLAAGEACALTGANGVGKTSLLRAVAGLLAAEAGAIDFGEAPAERLHFLGHLDGLKPGRTGAEELDFWVRWQGGSAVQAARAVEILALSPLLGLEIRRLSAGQRRRLALARLMAAPRPLWLLDEPMSPLDVDWRARFGAIMADHLAGGGLILAAVHDPLPIPARSLALAS